MFRNEELLTVIEFWGCERSAVLFNSHNIIVSMKKPRWMLVLDF